MNAGFAYLDTMTRGLGSFAAFLALPALMNAGCAHVFDTTSGGVGIMEGDNTHRYATFRGDQKLKICMEAVGPAAMTHRFDALFAMRLQNEQNLAGAGKGKGKGADGTTGDGDANFAYRNFQDLGLQSGITYQDQLAQLFTVDDIMQFEHETLYRLCEARANDDVTNEQYNALFSAALGNTQTLIKQQMDNQLALDSARLSASIQVLAAAQAKEIDRHNASVTDLGGKPAAPEVEKQKESERVRHNEAMSSISATMAALVRQHDSTLKSLRDDKTDPEPKPMTPEGATGGSDGGTTTTGPGSAQPPGPTPGPAPASTPPSGNGGAGPSPGPVKPPHPLPQR